MAMPGHLVIAQLPSNKPMGKEPPRLHFSLGGFICAPVQLYIMKTVLHVAVLFSGRTVQEHGGGGDHSAAVTSREFQRAVIAPLAGMHVDAYVAGKPKDRAVWMDWFQNTSVSSVTWAELAGPDAPTGNERLLRCMVGSEKPARKSWRYAYYDAHRQYRSAWDLMQKSEKVYDFVIRARSDLTYHPNQTISPCWLTHLQQGELLAVDKAYHQHFRWNEHKSFQYPNTCEDQFLVGRMATMHNFFTIDESWNTTDCGNMPLGPERIIAVTLQAQGVKVHTVNLQVQAIKGSDWRHLDTGWISTPCLACSHLGCV